MRRLNTRKDLGLRVSVLLLHNGSIALYRGVVRPFWTGVGGKPMTTDAAGHAQDYLDLGSADQAGTQYMSKPCQDLTPHLSQMRG